jgi:hypothetical protein
VLDAVTEAPAWVRNARHDVLAAKRRPPAGHLTQRAPLFRQVA